MTGKEMIIYLCTFLFVLPQKEKIPKEKSQALNLRGYFERVFAKSQALNLRGYFERVFAKRQETRFASDNLPFFTQKRTLRFTPLRLGAAMRRWVVALVWLDAAWLSGIDRRA